MAAVVAATAFALLPCCHTVTPQQAATLVRQMTSRGELLLEDTFHVTHGIEVDARLIALDQRLHIQGAELAPGVTLEPGGTISGAPERPGAFTRPIRLCRPSGCVEEVVTLVVHRNTPWRPGKLTFPAQTGRPLNETIEIEGGPPDVPPTFTVTDSGKLPGGVTIGPDGRIGGVPHRAGVFDVPVRVCVAGNCAGVVATLIVV
ncbi:hypothetical protein [Thermoactinospora rubra]|uniref:hypothetical protein n=1 Tax=Thermoactinospora rubra TaxID=1088767 RepID=UPI00197F0DF1|nr:hypothetical protein [Thermoactinospora rubra]